LNPLRIHKELNFLEDRLIKIVFLPFGNKVYIDYIGLKYYKYFRFIFKELYLSSVSYS